MATYDVLVIGAGNLGLWTAYHLARQGVKRIAVCERAWAGFGATTRSAGMVRQQGGSRTASLLGRDARTLYLQLGQELGLDSGFTELGYYILAETAEEKANYQELVAIRRELGIENEWIDAEEGRRRFPAVNWDYFIGATYAPTDGYVHPLTVARNITYGVLRTAAIDLHEMTAVEAIGWSGGRYLARTTRGVFEAERVVDAGGPRGARTIGAMVDVNVPVSATRHQVVTYPTAPPELGDRFPLLFTVANGFYIRPEEQGVLLGMSNPREDADSSNSYQVEFDVGFYEDLRPVWEARVPSLAGRRVSRAWAASIDYTPDHLPIIDEPRDGFYVLAAGGHGMMWGPALGMKMAELIVRGAVSDLPDEDIKLDRFTAPRARKDAIALPFPAR